MAVRRLKNAGYKLIVISNQPGVARKLFKESDLLAINGEIQTLLAPYGVKMDAFYYCPHGPATVANAASRCRDSFFKQLRSAIDLRDSWMISDILHDVEAGNSASSTASISMTATKPSG